MSVNLKGRSFLTLRDLSAEEILHLLDFSSELKAEKKRGIRGKRLEGKNIVLIFEKTSTRTRCAFEAAAYDEGGRVTFLTNSQMGVKTPPGFSAAITTASSSGAAARKRWSSWPSTPVFPCGTA